MSNLLLLKKQIIVEQVLNMMLEESIEAVTFTKISKKLEIGEATLYRYFHNKENLVISCCVCLWERTLSKYFNESDINPNLNGFERIKVFFNTYLSLYENERYFLNFVNKFDQYVIEKKINIDSLEIYNNVFEKIKSLYDSLILLGKKDGSIKDNIDYELFYYGATHSLFSLCQKLSSQYIIKSDNYFDGVSQIREIINTILYYIRREK